MTFEYTDITSHMMPNNAATKATIKDMSNLIFELAANGQGIVYATKEDFRYKVDDSLKPDLFKKIDGVDSLFLAYDNLDQQRELIKLLESGRVNCSEKIQLFNKCLAHCESIDEYIKNHDIMSINDTKSEVTYKDFKQIEKKLKNLDSLMAGVEDSYLIEGIEKSGYSKSRRDYDAATAYITDKKVKINSLAFVKELYEISKSLNSFKVGWIYHDANFFHNRIDPLDRDLVIMKLISEAYSEIKFIYDTMAEYRSVDGNNINLNELKGNLDMCKSILENHSFDVVMDYSDVENLRKPIPEHTVTIGYDRVKNRSSDISPFSKSELDRLMESVVITDSRISGLEEIMARSERVNPDLYMIDYSNMKYLVARHDPPNHKPRSLIAIPTLDTYEGETPISLEDIDTALADIKSRQSVLKSKPDEQELIIPISPMP